MSERHFLHDFGLLSSLNTPVLLSHTIMSHLSSCACIFQTFGGKSLGLSFRSLCLLPLFPHLRKCDANSNQTFNLYIVFSSRLCYYNFWWNGKCVYISLQIKLYHFRSHLKYSVNCFMYSLLVPRTTLQGLNANVSDYQHCHWFLGRSKSKDLR